MKADKNPRCVNINKYIFIGKPICFCTLVCGDFLHVFYFQWTISTRDPSLDDVKFESVSTLAEAMIKQVKIIMAH